MFSQSAEDIKDFIGCMYATNKYALSSSMWKNYKTPTNSLKAFIYSDSSDLYFERKITGDGDYWYISNTPYISDREYSQLRMEKIGLYSGYLNKLDNDTIIDSLFDYKLKLKIKYLSLLNTMKLIKHNLKRKKPKYGEHAIQKAFFDYLAKYKKELRPLCFSIPNDGARSLIQGALLKQRGLTRGVPDVFCAIPNRAGKHGLFIEFKYGCNSTSEHQDVMIGNLIDNNYECKICYSAEEAIKVLDEYINALWKGYTYHGDTDKQG